MLRLEKLYNLKDNFKNVTNYKPNISYIHYEVINLGTNDNTQTVNIGTNCSLAEKQSFIKLFNEYKDIFAWTYDNLNTFDTNIIPHIMPMNPNANPFQKMLRKMHPNLEPLVKGELNKLLAAKIIFPIIRTQWIENLLPFRKKN
jgi:hypothetical protein